MFLLVEELSVSPYECVHRADLGFWSNLQNEGVSFTAQEAADQAISSGPHSYSSRCSRTTTIMPILYSADIIALLQKLNKPH